MWCGVGGPLLFSCQQWCAKDEAYYLLLVLSPSPWLAWGPCKGIGKRKEERNWGYCPLKIEKSFSLFVVNHGMWFWLHLMDERHLFIENFYCFCCSVGKSLQLRGLQHARLPCPSLSSGIFLYHLFIKHTYFYFSICIILKIVKWILYYLIYIITVF